MTDIAIRVENLSKMYGIGRARQRHDTLLKILTRIVEPTGGSFDLYGRVGSPLEVGTGCHPEPTGREDVYLDEAILGMRKTEIEREFDAILEFSGVEKFLDTPVKWLADPIRYG